MKIENSRFWEEEEEEEEELELKYIYVAMTKNIFKTPEILLAKPSKSILIKIFIKSGAEPFGSIEARLVETWHLPNVESPFNLPASFFPWM